MNEVIGRKNSGWYLFTILISVGIGIVAVASFFAGWGWGIAEGIGLLAVALVCAGAGSFLFFMVPNDLVMFDGSNIIFAKPRERIKVVNIVKVDTVAFGGRMGTLVGVRAVIITTKSGARYTQNHVANAFEVVAKIKEIVGGET